MRVQVVLLGVALAVTACKKSGGGGGGGGGGSWLVGSSGLVVHVDARGATSADYSTGSTEELRGIACRYAGEAWIVGTAATLLYTNDAGQTWSPAAIPTTADLAAVATQDSGPIFVGGDGVFLVSTDTGATWTSLGDGKTQFRSIAAAQASDTVFALGEDGSVWSYEGERLAPRTTLPGARSIAISPDGAIAIVAGDGLVRSVDAGSTWKRLATTTSFDDVRIADDGTAIAVGARGAIANIDDEGNVVVQYVGTADLHTVHLADADSADPIGYAAGDGGQVLVTHDGGASWSIGSSVGRTVFGVDEIGVGHR